MLLPGMNEWLIILLVIALLFGASKLPQLARSAGKGIAEFRKAQLESELELKELERKIREGKHIRTDTDRLIELAESLGIDPDNKTDDELLDEIRAKLRA